MRWRKLLIWIEAHYLNAPYWCVEFPNGIKISLLHKKNAEYHLKRIGGKIYVDYELLIPVTPCQN